MAQSLVKTIADFNTVLVTAVAVGDTTATLQTATDDDGVALPSGTYVFTIDRNNASKEYFQCSLSGTALTNVKTLARGTAVATSGFARAHRKGAEIIISDFAAIKRITDLLDGTTDFDSATPLEYDGNPTFTPGSNQIATIKYADDLAIAGSPDATTSTKGIVKMSTAPVSAASPIAVGDNDTRVPTQAENDALAGTSGAPSSTNKYVTNDDTASAATASKVARRNATGDITVPTTPTASTDAASKSYVDTQVTTVDIKNYVPNTIEASASWYTWQMPVLTYIGAGANPEPTGWTENGFAEVASDYGAGYNTISLSNNGGSIMAYLPGTGSTDYYDINTSKKWRIKFYARVENSTNIWGFGVMKTGDVTDIYDAETTTAPHQMRIVWNSSNMYLANSDGTNYTSNTISGITRTNWNLYELYYDGSNVYCYVNGTLKATNSTNLPTSSGNYVLIVGGSAIGTSLVISPITISLEL